MSSGFLARYAHQSVSPEHRASLFIDGEARLTWISLFFDQFPEADIYLVGGTLRDTVLGKIPADIDLVIRNVPTEELERWLQAHGACELAGRRFGTFKFSPHGAGVRAPIDIALPRTEQIGDEHFSGRRDLQIQFDHTLPIKDDLSRRDFTINAMAFDIRRARFIDPFDGMDDLHAGIIRAVRHPSERFYEDATRVLRGLRFACQLSFGIEEHTWKALKDSIGLLNNVVMREDGTHAYAVAREMIGREFLLGFIKHPTHAVNIWKESGALELFLPELSDLPEQFFVKTLETLHILQRPALLAQHKMQSPSATVLVAALFTYTGDDRKTHAYKTCKNLYFHQFPQDHYANINCKDVFWLVDQLHLFEEQDPAAMRPSHFEKQFCNERGENLLLFMHAVAIASAKHSIARERLHTARRILEKMMQTICPTGDITLTHLVNGNDLKEMGMAPGPHFREVKNYVRDAQLVGSISEKEEALDLARHYMRTQI